MPNWCFTHMIFHGNKEEITDFHSKITEWTSIERVKSDFECHWLGNVLHGAGLGGRIDNKENGLRCRGEIIYLGDIQTSEDEAWFDLDTSTAWVPMCLMWTAVIGELEYDSINYSYMAEEPGCELYEICDPYGDFPEQYYVDIYLEGEDETNDALLKLYYDRYYCTDEALKEALMTLLDTHEEDLAYLISAAENYEFKNEDSYISIHKYEMVDIPND